MSITTKAGGVTDAQLVGDIFERIASDLGMIIDRAVEIEGTTVERMHRRAEGRGQVHISFKLGFKSREQIEQGCVLIPLPDAITLAAYLMMLPDDEVRALRPASELDRSTKDAMLELGNFIGGATDAVIRNALSEGYSVRSQGCQGVRADVRPALQYEEGSELIVGRTQARIHDFESFEMILMLPAIKR